MGTLGSCSDPAFHTREACLGVPRTDVALQRSNLSATFGVVGSRAGGSDSMVHAVTAASNANVPAITDTVLRRQLSDESSALAVITPVSAAVVPVPSAPPLQPVWSTPRIGSFDDFGAAMLTLYIMSTGDEWEWVMFRMMDSTGHGTGPVRNDGMSLAAAFCLAWMFVGSFFAMNLIVGVIVDEFNRTKAATEAGEDDEDGGLGANTSAVSLFLRLWPCPRVGTCVCSARSDADCNARVRR